MAFQVCFIGCGRQAHKAYAEPLRKYRQAHPDTVLKCCCDVNLQAAEEFAQSVGFESFDSDYEAMLKREKPDAVILVTPFVVTASIARKVLSMGIPALIEKPLGVNTQEAETIAEAAAQSGIIVSTGGGVILDPDNVAALKKTGVLFFLDRPLDLLRPASDRPLSSSADKLTAMFEVRYPLYCAAADHRIRADRTPEEEAAQILKAFSE